MFMFREDEVGVSRIVAVIGARGYSVLAMPWGVLVLAWKCIHVLGPSLHPVSRY